MMDKSTGELMEILKSEKKYEVFFSNQVGELFFGSVSQYLETMMRNKNLNKSDVIKRSNLDKNYAYQIFNGTKKNPSRNKMLMIAIGMELNIEETQTLLKMSELTELYVRMPRDSIIIHCINMKKNIIETNEILNDYKQELLE
ncbi:MAG: hypothetical protein MJ177_08405 [Clostridia bacterium]|nr:hypothetical protein [Clostridia bacterium]